MVNFEMDNTDTSLADELITLVKAHSNNNPPPKQGYVNKIYDDQKHIDVKLEDGSILNYVLQIGQPVIDDDVIVVFPDGNSKRRVAITPNNHIIQKFRLNQESAGKFNYAIITKTEGTITYEELWILSNAYYDYTAERFVKIDDTHTSFGVQIQANGTYPGEAELGYSDNVGINIWRNPKKSDVYKDTTAYDYTDFDNKNYLGAKRLSDNKWVEYAISSGWNNSFMIDSYGGMTIGGSGFEIDGNGLFIH